MYALHIYRYNCTSVCDSGDDLHHDKRDFCTTVRSIKVVLVRLRVEGCSSVVS